MMDDPLNPVDDAVRRQRQRSGALLRVDTLEGFTVRGRHRTARTWASSPGCCGAGGLAVGLLTLSAHGLSVESFLLAIFNIPVALYWFWILPWIPLMLIHARNPLRITVRGDQLLLSGMLGALRTCKEQRISLNGLTVTQTSIPGPGLQAPLLSLTLREADGTTWPLWPLHEGAEGDVAALVALLQAEAERATSASSKIEIPEDMSVMLTDGRTRVPQDG